MYHNDQWNQLPGSSVIERWPYGDDLLTPLQISTEMGLGQTMPTSASLEAHELNRRLLYPIARHIFDFQYSVGLPPSRDVLTTGEYVIRRHRHERGRERREVGR